MDEVERNIHLKPNYKPFIKSQRTFFIFSYTIPKVTSLTHSFSLKKKINPGKGLGSKVGP
jgi:hypothetical protein